MIAMNCAPAEKNGFGISCDKEDESFALVFDLNKTI